MYSEGDMCVLDLMHGRSRMTIHPRIPTMPGRSMSCRDAAGDAGTEHVGFSPHCLHQARSAV